MAKIIKADWYFIIPTALIFFSALLVTLWDFIQIQEMMYRLQFVNVVGLSSFVIGIAIRRVAKRTLGKHYSYVLKTEQKSDLIDYGIYKHIRHPIYSAMLMYCIAIPLIFSSVYGFLFMLWVIPCTVYRIKIEENMLIEKFKNRYKDYMNHTKKLIPYIY